MIRLMPLFTSLNANPITKMKNATLFRWHIIQSIAANITNGKGGMVLWLQVPKLNLEKFTKLIEKHKIDIRLGQLFSTLPLYNDCFRINIGFNA